MTKKKKLLFVKKSISHITNKIHEEMEKAYDEATKEFDENAKTVKICKLSIQLPTFYRVDLPRRWHSVRNHSRVKIRRRKYAKESSN